MNLQKHIRLVEKLADLTGAGGIQWNHSAEENEFQLSFKDNSIRIRQTVGRDSKTVFIDLLNSEGSIVETFHDGELDDFTGNSPNSVWLEKMSNLYTAARRSALGSDKVLDSILNELDDIIPF